MRYAGVNEPEYLSQLIENREVDLVKGITGMRRCGKSSRLDLFHVCLTDNRVEEAHIVHRSLKLPRAAT